MTGPDPLSDLRRQRDWIAGQLAALEANASNLCLPQVQVLRDQCALIDGLIADTEAGEH